MRVSARYRLTTGLAAFYMLSSAAWVFGWRNSYPALGLVPLLGIGKVSAYAFGAGFSMVTVFTFLEDEGFEWLKVTFALVGVANTVMVIGQWAAGQGQKMMGGIFGNPSISGCFTAAAYPAIVLMVGRMPIPRRFIRFHFLLIPLAILLPLIAVVAPGASAPMFTLGIVMLAVCGRVWVQGKSFNWRGLGMFTVFGAFLTLVVCGVGTMVSYHKMTHGTLFSDSGRFFIWKLMMSGWWNNGHVWIGQGTGTSQIIIPLAQQFYKQAHPEYPMSDIWLWFHNDYLQMIFENGIIGGALVLAALLVTVKAAWGKHPWVFGSLLGFLAAGVFNFPAHFPIHAFFGLLVIFTALRRDDEKVLNHN